MRSVRSFLMISVLSMSLAALASGCAMDVAAEEERGFEADIEVGAPEEAIDETGEAQDTTDVAEAPDDVGGAPDETAATGKPVSDTSSARENGDWCHAVCNNEKTYAGPNVTANCTEWAHMVCHHRNTTLFQAFWCKPGQCGIDVILGG